MSGSFFLLRDRRSERRDKTVGDEVEHAEVGELPLLAGIAAFLRWCEELVVLLSGPLLLVGLGIGLVALLSDGALLVTAPWLLYAWALSQTVGVDGQLVGAWPWPSCCSGSSSPTSAMWPPWSSPPSRPITSRQARRSRVWGWTARPGSGSAQQSQCCSSASPAICATGRHAGGGRRSTARSARHPEKSGAAPAKGS